MNAVHAYVSHQVNTEGFINYSTQEALAWEQLYSRQLKQLPGHACREFLEGLAVLNFPAKEIPQLPDVTKILKAETGWEVTPVPALISPEEFFGLLSQRIFPAATFIRPLSSLDYIKEPDIFHELFGHCPMLTHPVFAEFVYAYAKEVESFPNKDWALLQRLFWFTVEFGLIQTQEGLRAYGGGILSSPEETRYSITSDRPLRVYFDPVAAFRTPYRIDILQPVYFVINDFQDLYDLVIQNLAQLIDRARILGEFKPLFFLDNNKACIHINAC